MLQMATVKYQIATYSGEVRVSCQEDDDNETIIARAKSQLRRKVGELPFGYQSYDVVGRKVC